MTADRPRLGIFGGSFDPVHNAHLALAHAAFEQLGLDELRWVPTGQPWQKTRQVTDAAHREAMVRLAIDATPHWRLDRCELEREGPSYTLDTVRELQSRGAAGRWFLIIGRDQYDGLRSWHGWEELMQRVTLAVANRPGTAPPDPAAGLPHCVVELPLMEVSSTAIRRRLADGQGIDDLVPAAVAGYIDQYHLYREEEFGS